MSTGKEATPSGSIAIVLNGDPATVRQGLPLAGMVEELGRDPRPVAIEYNGEGGKATPPISSTSSREVERHGGRNTSCPDCALVF